MKKHLAVIMLIALAFLVSCAGKNGGETDFISAGTIQSVHNDVLITVSKNVIYYTDLSQNITTPICSRPNCNHQKGSEQCTARARADDLGAITCPLVYGNNLYFFFDNENRDIILYKCTLDGGNRQIVFTYGAPKKDEKKDDETEYINSGINNVIYKNGKLYFFIYLGVMKKIDGQWVTSGARNSQLFCYDFAADKCEMVYETGFLSQIQMRLNTMEDLAIYYELWYHKSDKYDYMKGDELMEQITDVDSDYNKGLTYEYGYIDVTDGKRVIFTDGEKLPEETQPQTPLKWQVRSETLNYFLVYENGWYMSNRDWVEQYAILKSDYYNGDDTAFIIDEPKGAGDNTSILITESEE